MQYVYQSQQKMSQFKICTSSNKATHYSKLVSLCSLNSHLPLFLIPSHTPHVYKDALDCSVVCINEQTTACALCSQEYKCLLLMITCGHPRLLIHPKLHPSPRMHSTQLNQDFSPALHNQSQNL